MKSILWICDVPDWAYDINAKMLAANMPQCKHYHGYKKKFQEVLENLGRRVDIVVAMNPTCLHLYKRFDNLVSILDSVRALTPSRLEILSKVAGVICTNKVLFDVACTKNSNVILQPNGVNLDSYYPLPWRNTEKFTVGFAANIEGANADYKGWPPYQEAVNSLGDRIEQRNAIRGKHQIAANRMVPDFYHKIDCLVLPSKNEGCSNVIAEALSCGVPAICTKIGYHGHALENYKQCIFVERAGESIKKAILQMVENPSLYRSMREEARKFAVDNHDIRLVAQNYVNFFERITPNV
jgi:glycosyltransferase involved in cell wall biosynthesis